MNNATGWLIAALLLFVLLKHRSCWLLLLPASALVYWDFGSRGLIVLWTVLLVASVRSKAVGR